MSQLLSRAGAARDIRSGLAASSVRRRRRAGAADSSTLPLLSGRHTGYCVNCTSINIGLGQRRPLVKKVFFFP